MKEYEQKIHNIINNAEEDVIFQAYQAYEQGYATGYAHAKRDDYANGKADTPFTDTEEAEKKAYNRGLKEAWDAARKLCQSVKYGGLEEYCSEIFEKTPFETFDVFDYTASEAIAKIKEYEDKQKQDTEIKVGDEVIVQDDRIGFVTGYDVFLDRVYVATKDGWSDAFERLFVRKTGRHFPQIAEVLAELRGAENDE